MADNVDKPPPVDVVQASVWAYKYGYLSILLGGRPVAERARRLAAGRRCFPRLLLLCPEDGWLPEPAGRLHARLSALGSADEMEAAVAGARRRLYGGHPVYELQVEGERQVVAAEAVGSLRTLRVVADAMARAGRQLKGGGGAQLARGFVAALRAAVEGDPALREAFAVVVYDPADAAQPAAAIEATVAGRTPPRDPPAAAETQSSLPDGVGAYLAWSFLHGYLLLVAGKRDLAAQLAPLDAPLGVSKVVVVCPLWPGWTEEVTAAQKKDNSVTDITALDAALQPVSDLSGVSSGVPALAGRTYGSLTVYRAAGDAGLFALEVATPLRTLSLGLAGERRAADLYAAEARRFVAELQDLLETEPEAARQFAVLPLERGAALSAGLREMTRFRGAAAEAPAAQQAEEASWNCRIL